MRGGLGPSGPKGWKTLLKPPWRFDPSTHGDYVRAKLGVKLIDSNILASAKIKCGAASAFGFFHGRKLRLHVL